MRHFLPANTRVIKIVKHFFFLKQNISYWFRIFLSVQTIIYRLRMHNMHFITRTMVLYNFVIELLIESTLIYELWSLIPKFSTIRECFDVLNRVAHSAYTPHSWLVDNTVIWSRTDLRKHSVYRLNVINIGYCDWCNCNCSWIICHKNLSIYSLFRLQWYKQFIVD